MLKIIYVFQIYVFYVKLEQDFEILYPEHNLKLYVAWPKLSDFIINRVSSKAKTRLDNVFTPGKISKFQYVRYIMLTYYFLNICFFEISILL